MTRDLEETLAELGPGYREVVERLRGCEAVRPAQRRFAPAAYLAAASVAAALLGVVCVFAARPGRTQSEATRAYTAAYGRGEAEIAAILASQRADGSWANDFLTRQNAAALRRAEGEGAAVAYKRAARYLKSKGLKPLTDEELDLRSAAARSIVRL